MGFRSHVRHFRGAILGLLRPSEAWCFAPGRWFFPWCFPIWGPDVKVAKIHGSSKRKKEPKASFFMGFRSHVRHFRGAILELLRPSEAWCFAPGRWFFSLSFPIWGPDVKVAKIHGSSKRKKEPKASFSMGFRRDVRQFWGSILAPFRPSGPLCFPVRQRAFSASGGRAAAATGAAGGFYVSLCLINVQTAVQKMVENYCFSRVSEGTLGSFWARFWRCSVLQGHCVSLSGSVRFQLREEEQQQQQEQQEGSMSHYVSLYKQRYKK